jgi:hypothetical protein
MVGTGSTRTAGFDVVDAMPAVGFSPTASRPQCLFGAAPHMLWVRRRRALPMTLTEESAIAAAAIIGDSNQPKAG